MAMPDTPPPSSASPPVPALVPPGGPRLDALDLLRGVAILGIFLMNTQSMSMPQEAYMNPAAYTPAWETGFGFPPYGEPYLLPQGVTFWVYAVVHVLADMKFITIFSVMFGAGIVLQAERAAKRGLNPWLIHYERMGVLLVFGLIHAYCVWMGDILVSYVLCGMLLAPLRKLPPAVLLGLGLLLIGIPVVVMLERTLGWHWQWLNPLQAVDGRLAGHMGTDLELAAYRGGWWQQMSHRAWASLRGETTEFLVWTGPRCGGCMLLGMALQRWKFYHGQWGRPAYALLAMLLIPVGWLLTTLGVIFNHTTEWSEEWTAFLSVWGLGAEFNYWGSLLTAVGYMAAGVLVAMWAADPARRVLRAALVPVRAVGRTALTNYLSQSLIGTTLFYGHGLGWYGKLTRLELLYVVAAVWTVQLIVSPFWLRYFRQGPMEWLWHTLVYAGRREGATG
jgi:uncharacterized protein